MNEKMITTPDEADFKDWLRALNLKIAAVEADLEYAHATSFCSDCPKRLDEDRGDDWRVFRADCCKETDEWEEQYEPDIEYIQRLKKAQDAIRELIHEEEKC